jgi:DNA-binding response OmpR family regulator
VNSSDRPTVLVIDDDRGTQREVRKLLERERMLVVSAGDGTAGLREFYERRPDLITLDLQLNGHSGHDVMARVRELSDVPILVLTGLTGEIETVRALREGADDYVTKPFAGAELVARIEALLRRRVEQDEAPLLHVDDLIRIDHPQRSVEVLGTVVALTPTEFRLLWTLASHSGQVLTHVQLLELVWPGGIEETDRIKLYVGYVRRKLLDAGGVDPIETVRGFGYRYCPRLAERKPEPAL